MSDLAFSGRQLIVTDSEILEAGRRLEADGKPVTGYSLRKALGDRGTHRKLMEVWTRETVPAEPAAPPAYVEALQALRGEVVAQAADAADALLDRAWRALFDAAESKTAGEIAALQAKIADQTRGTDDLEKALEEADGKRAKLFIQIQEIGVALAQSEDAVARTARDAEDQANTIVRLNGIIIGMQADLVQAKSAQAAAEATATAAREDADRIRQALVVERAEIKNLYGDFSRIQSAHAVLESRMTVAQEQSERLSRDLLTERAARESTQADLDRALAAQAVAEAAIGAARSEADRSRQELVAERAGRDALFERASVAEATLRGMEAAQVHNQMRVNA